MWGRRREKVCDGSDMLDMLEEMGRSVAKETYTWSAVLLCVRIRLYPAQAVTSPTYGQRKYHSTDQRKPRDDPTNDSSDRDG